MTTRVFVSGPGGGSAGHVQEDDVTVHGHGLLLHVRPQEVHDGRILRGHQNIHGAFQGSGAGVLHRGWGANVHADFGGRVPAQFTKAMFLVWRVSSLASVLVVLRSRLDNTTLNLADLRFKAVSCSTLSAKLRPPKPRPLQLLLMMFLKTRDRDRSFADASPHRVGLGTQSSVQLLHKVQGRHTFVANDEKMCVALSFLVLHRS